MCLFCLLETTSVNDFMKSFPKSEYWNLGKIAKKTPVFSARFFGLQEFDISTRFYSTSCRDSRRGFGRLDFEISLRPYLKSCQDSWRVFCRQDFEISNLGEILRSRRESRRVFGRRDFEISPRSRRESRRDFKISPRSHRDLGNLAG